MPLLHRIIRQDEAGSGNHRELYKLNTRYDFLLQVKQEEQVQPQREQARDQARLIIEKARAEARAIVEAARQQAGAILEQARQAAAGEAEQIKSAAAREGYEQGYREALEAAREDAEKTRAAARKVLEQAEQLRREKLAGLKDEILGLALEIAEKVVARELELQPGVVLGIAGEALQLVANRKTVVLKVNPVDWQACRDNKEQLLNHLPPRAELNILTDEQIERGGCVVETDYGRVDARITARWENVIQAIKGEAS